MVIAVALALLDFAPVFFLALGLFFLAQLVDRLDPQCRRLALSGLALVVVGGLGRTISNLVLAVTATDVPLLTTTLLVFGGPGFTLMAGAVIRARAKSLGNASHRDPWTAPLILGWLFLFSAFYLDENVGRGAWSPTLVLLTFIGNLATAWAAADLGWRRQLHVAALLYAFNVAGAITLIALHTISRQSLLLQLLEVVLSLCSNAAFAFASWRVAAEYHARIGPTAPE